GNDPLTNQPQRSQRPFAIALTLVYAVIAILVRLIPFGVRPPNVAANGALSVFGGSRAPIWVPLPAPLLSPSIRELLPYKAFRWEPFNITVYVSFVIYMLLGRFLLKGNDSLGRIAGVTFLGSLQFFVLTNLAEWLQYSGIIGNSQKTYDATLAGLLTCFVKA